MSMSLGIGLGLSDVSRWTAPWAPAGSFDWYVDGISGDDANDGSSPELAWKTFAPLRTAVTGLTASQVRTALIRSTTYTDDHLSLTNSASPRADVTLTFEEGAALLWQSASAPGNGIAAANTLKVTANGNGCAITGFSPSSGNGLGANNSGYLIANDFIVDDADDGVSAHLTSRIDAYGCVFRNCVKSAFAIVNSAVLNAYGCTFEGRAGATLGIGAYLDTSSGTLEDCIFTPIATGQNIRLSQGGAVTVTRGRLGTLSAYVTLLAENATPAINDSFLNLYVDGSYRAAFAGCYGRLTTRQRAGGAISIANCVLVGGASGLTNSVLFRNFDGGQGGWSAIDSVLTGYATAVGGSFGPVDAGYFETAGSTVTYTDFFANTVNVDPDIAATAADVTTGVITTDPQIGPAASYVRNDYAVAAGSPCVGAGSAGGDIGFQAA